MPETRFSQLVEVFERLEKTASNLAMIDILADFFPKISPEEAKISAYLFKNPNQVLPVLYQIPTLR